MTGKNRNSIGSELKKAFSTGVSYMMPSVIIGGGVTYSV